MAIVLLTISACGSSSAKDAGGRSRTQSVHRDAGAAARRGSNVSQAEVGVIEGWADALRAGQPGRAASFWAHPSVMVNGPDASGQVTLLHILNQRDAELADETLPCGATLRHTTRRGSYVEGEFTLASRTGAGAGASGCSGPASVDFLISRGHIVRWLRAPIVPPGAKPTVKSAPAQSA